MKETKKMLKLFLLQFKIELSQQFEQLQNIRQSNVDEDGNDVTDPVRLKPFTPGGTLAWNH